MADVKMRAKGRSRAAEPVKSPSIEVDVVANGKRAYVKQADVPSAALSEALRVPEVIFDHYAGQPTAPIHVAAALDVDPKGSQFRVLSGAAIAFGLIEGGSQAAAISVTELARRIIRPKEDGEDFAAKKDSVLRPRIFGEFLRKYDGSTFPRPEIAVNVIEAMGVPRSKAIEVFERIEESATSVDFFKVIKGKKYVVIEAALSAAHSGGAPEIDDEVIIEESPKFGVITRSEEMPLPAETRRKSPALSVAYADDQRRKRVFITHGKNRALVDPIKKLLDYGELIPVVSVERQSVSKPVPEKFMDDMRACGAAIIHVDADHTIVDAESKSHVIINPNVLIEIGAAMAFYGRRFILLVKDGITLPSNLQGLYEVRYSGEVIDAASTIKLLEAMKDIKNYSLPTDADE